MVQRGLLSRKMSNLAGIAQRLVCESSKLEMSVRFRLPAHKKSVHIIWCIIVLRIYFQTEWFNIIESDFYGPIAQ